MPGMRLENWIEENLEKKEEKNKTKTRYGDTPALCWTRGSYENKSKITLWKKITGAKGRHQGPHREGGNNKGEALTAFSSAKNVAERGHNLNNNGKGDKYNSGLVGRPGDA